MSPALRTRRLFILSPLFAVLTLCLPRTATAADMVEGKTYEVKVVKDLT